MPALTGWPCPWRRKKAPPAEPEPVALRRAYVDGYRRGFFDALHEIGDTHDPGGRNCFEGGEGECGYCCAISKIDMYNTMGLRVPKREPLP